MEEPPVTAATEEVPEKTVETPAVVESNEVAPATVEATSEASEAAAEESSETAPAAEPASEGSGSAESETAGDEEAAEETREIKVGDWCIHLDPGYWFIHVFILSLNPCSDVFSSLRLHLLTSVSLLRIKPGTASPDMLSIIGQ